MRFVWELCNLHFGWQIYTDDDIIEILYVCSLMIYLGKNIHLGLYTHNLHDALLSMHECKQHNYSSDKLVFNWVSNII